MKEEGMKYKLPIISTVIIILVFGLVIAGCFLWQPIKIKWLEGRLENGTPHKK